MRLTMKKRLLPLLLTAFVSTSAIASVPNDAASEPQSFSGAYLAGRVARSQMQLDDAASYFRQVLKYQPNDSQAQKEAFITFLSAGDFNEAVVLAEKLKKDPDFGFFSTLALVVNDLRQNKQYDLTKIDKKSVAFSAPENLQLRILNAWATLGQGKTRQAISTAKELVVTDKWLINFQIASMYDLTNQAKEAEKYYAQAFNEANLNQQLPYIYERIAVGYASFLQRQHKQAEALTILKQAKENLTNSYVLDEVEKRIEQNIPVPALVNNAAAGAGEMLYSLGIVLAASKNDEIAQLYFQLALGAEPQNDGALFQLGDIAARITLPQRVGAPEQAIKFFEKISPNSPYYLDAKLRTALAYAEKGDNEKAIELFSTLEKEKPEDRRISMVLTGLYMRLDQFDNAEKVLNRTISQITTPQPIDWILYYQRGIAFERQQNWNKAEPDFRKALELYPNQPEVLNYLGYSLIDRNEKLDEAVDMLKRAVSQRPDDGFIVDSLGWAFYKLGRYDDAAKKLEKAVMLQPADATINDHLGDAYWKIGRKRDAVFQWTYALAFKPEAKDVPLIEAKLKHGLK